MAIKKINTSSNTNPYDNNPEELYFVNRISSKNRNGAGIDFSALYEGTNNTEAIVDNTEATVDGVLKKPTGKEFLENLKNASPDDYEKLEKKYNIYSEEYPTFEMYIEGEMKPLYYSNEVEKRIKKYSGKNFAITDKGEVYYNSMGRSTNDPDSKFLGYGIWSRNEK